MNNLKTIDWHALPGADDIFRYELPNGIVILIRSNFNSPSVVVNGYLPCGSIFDPGEKLGLAYFTSIALMRGTAKRTFQEIYDAMETAGASLGFGASVHNISFGGRSLAEDLPLLLDLASESLCNPVFPVDHVERLRTQLLTSLAIRAQDTADMASLTFDEILFRGHPYSKPEDGYPDTLQNITRQDLIQFHQKHYGPRGMVIVVVGAIKPDEVIEQINHVLGDWNNPQQPDIPEMNHVVPPNQKYRQHIVLAGKTQADLVMGTLGPCRKDADFMAASLGNNILGQFGMMGRIGDAVREKSGLAYYASTSLNAWISSGSWEVNAGVNPANLERAIEIINTEIRRFITESVTAEELSDSQSNYIGRIPLSFESNAGVASGMLNIERFNLGLDYFRSYPALVAKITREEVLETARKYLNPDQFIVISAGPELPENKPNS